MSRFLSRVAYACGTFGHDFFYAMIGTYFMIFVTSNLFNTDDTNYNEYMIGLVTTVILVIRVADFSLTHSLVILSIKQKLDGVNLNLGFFLVQLLPQLL